MNNTSIMSSFLLFILFLAFTSTSTSATTTSSSSTDIKYCRLLGKDIHLNVEDGSFSSQVDGEKIKVVCTSKSLKLVGRSFAPRCVSKCGTCKPCVPVRVTVPTRSPPDYLPEVWRCECDHKLYMP